jgi:putative transcriptional regulator
LIPLKNSICVLYIKNRRESEGINMALGERGARMQLKLKQVMAAKKVSIRQLSLKSGVARGYISELIEGKYKNPGGQVLYKLARALGVKLDDIIDCDE